MRKFQKAIITKLKEITEFHEVKFGWDLNYNDEDNEIPLCPFAVVTLEDIDPRIHLNHSQISNMIVNVSVYASVSLIDDDSNEEIYDLADRVYYKLQGRTFDGLSRGLNRTGVDFGKIASLYVAEIEFETTLLEDIIPEKFETVELEGNLEFIYTIKKEEDTNG